MLSSHNKCLIFFSVIILVIGFSQGYFTHPEKYRLLDFLNTAWDFPGPNDKGASTILIFLLTPIIFIMDIIFTIITIILRVI